MDLFLLIPSVMTHPSEAFRLIKRDRRCFSYAPACLLLVLFLVLRIAQIFLTHYPLRTVDPWDANLFVECVSALVPILTFALVNYLLLTVLSGECYFREILTACAFSLLPVLVFGPILLAFSHVLCGLEAGLYYSLWSILYLWSILLIISSVKVMNQFTVGQTLLMCFISAAAMILTWFIFVLLFSLSQQFLQFIQGLLREARNLML